MKCGLTAEVAQTRKNFEFLV